MLGEGAQGKAGAITFPLVLEGRMSSLLSPATRLLMVVSFHIERVYALGGPVFFNETQQCLSARFLALRPLTGADVPWLSSFSSRGSRLASPRHHRCLLLGTVSRCLISGWL